MITAINVTPLVDVVLVLLIIMMVTSTYIVAHTLKVELPKATTSDGRAEEPVVLTVLPAGDVKLDGKAIAKDRVEGALRRLLKEREGMELVISADAKVEHGTVVSYIDIAKIAGVTKFAINVEKKAQARAGR